MSLNQSAQLCHTIYLLGALPCVQGSRKHDLRQRLGNCRRLAQAPTAEQGSGGVLWCALPVGSPTCWTAMTSVEHTGLGFHTLL